MNLIGGIVSGSLAGLLGAGIWGGVSYGTGHEVGWIAWGIGLIVGFGVAVAGRGRGRQAGLLAVVIAVLCILVGKYLSITMNDESPIARQLAARLNNDEVVISSIADQIVAEQADLGETVEWPSGVDTGQATGKNDYLPGVWKQAQLRWDQMSAEQRETYRLHAAENIRRTAHESLSQVRDGATEEGFLSSLGGVDILFFGLAIVTAFSVAAAGGLRSVDG